MKIKATLALVGLGLLGASVAFAAPPPGKGHNATTNASTTATTNGKPATGPGCKPAVAVILKGTLAANGAAAPAALTVNVTGGNHFALAYKGTAVSLATTAATKVSRQGGHALTDLRQNDRVNIQARACKADLANGAKPALTAVRVTAQAATA